MLQQHGYLQDQETRFERSAFLTWNGYAGYGPTSTKPGDTVWLLERGRVPYILRKNPSLNHFTSLENA